MSNVEEILYGVKEGDASWKETVLSTIPANFDRVKEIATRDGWGRFRIARIDLSEPPDFTKALTKEKRKR